MIKFELTLREIVLDDDFNEEKQRIVRDCLIFPPNKELHNFLNSKVISLLLDILPSKLSGLPSTNASTFLIKNIVILITTRATS